MPLIEYTFEFLAMSGVEEVFVYCGAHTQAVEDYIKCVEHGLLLMRLKPILILGYCTVLRSGPLQHLPSPSQSFAAHQDP